MSDDIIQRGTEWLEEFLSLSGLPASVMARDEGDSYWLTIDHSQLTPEQISALIGQEGDVIDALQYLCNTMLNIHLEHGEQTAYTIELNGYRDRRHKELRLMAEYAAAQVRLTGVDFELKSLSSPERRQVHSFLSEYDDIETYSRGEEPDRRLVVKVKI
jgi:spoIIIJ-associated protein